MSMETQEKLFETAKEKARPLPGQDLGRTHRPDFEDLLDPVEPAPAELKPEGQDFENGHLTLKFVESYNFPEFRRQLEKQEPQRMAAALNHFGNCQKCRDLRDRPDSVQ